jgi:WD40 repeat protein
MRSYRRTLVGIAFIALFIAGPAVALAEQAELAGPTDRPATGESAESAKQPASPRFIDRGEYVVDTATGLQWQKDGDASGKLNFYQAAAYASNLRLGGMTGWRVPTKEELAGIFPATAAPFVDTRYTEQPCCEGPYQWDSYWTSNLDTRLPNYAYVYHWYAKGGANNCYAAQNYVFVRCVRDPVQPAEDREAVATNIPESRQQVSVVVGGGTVTATTSDPDVEITAARRGELLKITDSKTGMRVTVNTREFSIQQGEGANSVRTSGDALTLLRGAMPLVEIRRGGGGSPAPRIARPAVLDSASPAVSPGSNLVSGDVSADGKHAVTAHYDQMVRLWDVASSRELRRLEPLPGRIRTVALAAGGRELVIVMNQELRFADVASGQMLRVVVPNQGEMQLADISADGRRLLVAAQKVVHVFNVASGRVERSLIHNLDIVNSIAISTDGRRGMVAGGYVSNSDTPQAESARVWDLESGSVLFDLRPSVRSSLHAALSPDGRRLAAPDLQRGGRLGLWDVNTGVSLRLFDSALAARRMMFSPDGQRLACQGIDGSILVLDVNGGRQVAAFQESASGAKLLGWSQGSNSLLGSDGTSIRQWRIAASSVAASSRPPLTPPPPMPATAELKRIDLEQRLGTVAFTSDGKQALIGGADTNLRLWDLETDKELKQYTGDKAHHILRHIVISPDGRTALLGGGLTRDARRLSLWSLETWREVRAFEGLEDVLGSVALSADGRLAAAGTIEGDALVWEIESGRKLPAFQPGVRGVRSVALAPDGKLAAYAGGHTDFRVRLWDVETGEQVRMFVGHARTVTQVCFVPDGKRVVSISDDQSIRVWDVATGKEIRKISERYLMRRLALAPDGRRAVVGMLDGTLSAWDLETGRQLARYAQHTGRVESVAVTADGQRVLSAAGDRTIRIWPLPPAGASVASEPPAREDSPAAAPLAADPGEQAAAAALERREGVRLHRDLQGFVFSANFREPLDDDCLTALAKFSKLRSLHLQTPVRAADLARIKNLSGLRSLTMINCDVDDAGLREICHLTELESLTLFETRITEAGLAEIKPLTELQSLSIYGSQITDQGLVHLQPLSRLVKLGLLRSQVNGTGLAHLHSLPALADLALSSSPITDEGLRQISVLSKLTVLQLGNCEQVGDAGVQHLSELTKLRSLHLYGTSITDDGLSHLKNLFALQSLNLGHTKITDAGLRHLDPLLNLRYLTLNNVKLSSEAIERLRDKLPHLARIVGQEKPSPRPATTNPPDP